MLNAIVKLELSRRRNDTKKSIEIKSLFADRPKIFDWKSKQIFALTESRRAKLVNRRFVRSLIFCAID